MLQYKLTVVDVTEENIAGADSPLKRVREEYAIGTFPNEQALQRWASENIGELEKAQEG